MMLNLGQLDIDFF